MGDVNTYRNAILEYLRAEKVAYQNDIDSHKNLSNDEKVELGLLIQGARITNRKGNQIVFSVSVNNTKLRPGDKVLLVDEEKWSPHTASVIENGFEKIELQCNHSLNQELTYSISIIERVYLDTMIQLIETIDNGSPGSILLEQLIGDMQPMRTGLGGFSYTHQALDILNESQLEICKAVLKRPSLYCIQGPPGTGKTDVLATIAIQFSLKGKEVVILSNTHQAVNNALNKISAKSLNLPIVKIGEELKAQDLDGHIMVADTYHEYVDYRKNLKKKPKEGSVVGMTLHAAVVNLGLRVSGLKPSVILVDEAGQMPLAEAICIGTFGCGSLVFIGDDKQMPPIFHESLKDSRFSKSVFSYICDKYPDLKGRLSVTYRMNNEITQYVSSHFYEPFGEILISSDISKDRRLQLNSIYPDDRIRSILNNEQSIHVLNVSQETTWEDYNTEEALFISELVKEAVACGMSYDDIAIITPYRKQVRTIRECVRAALGSEEIPLIDTVERLQGQDVVMIIVSFSVTSPTYFRSNKDFLLNPNRLNVMVSRAKRKAVLLASEIVAEHLK